MICSNTANHFVGFDAMRTVGRRLDSLARKQPRGEDMAAAAAFTQSLAGMGGGRLVRKGVYRFASHEDADRQLRSAIAQGMADLAKARQHG